MMEEKQHESLVTVSTGKTFTTRIQTGRHHFIADEPVEKGGNDKGPNPYDLLLSALGACTSITLRMYASRKEWPVDEINVRLRHFKIHAEDCEDCDSPTGRIDVIERHIEILGNIDEDQRERMLEIADKCPVHKTLHSEIKVRTTLD